MRRSALFITLVLIGALVGAILSPSSPARAEITTDFKEELIDQAQEIKGRLFDLQRAVHHDLAAKLFEAQYWVKRAYLEVKAAEDPIPPTQTAEITAKIQSAEYYKGLALQAVQTGGAVLEAKVALQEVIVETGMLISAAQTAPQKITPKEAQELQSGYLEPMLADLAYKDQLLIYIDYLLEEVNKRLIDAKAAVAEGDRREAKSELRRAKSKLRWAIARVWKIKWNLMTLIHRVYEFIAAITGAPVLGLSLREVSEPLVIDKIELLQASGMVGFTALGRGIAALRVQVFGLDGWEVFDSGFARGTTVEWHLMSAQAPPANGVYLYMVTIRGRDGSLIRSEVRKLVILR